MTALHYTIKWSRQSVDMLKRIADKRVRRKLVERVEALAVEPEKQGKPLTGDLTGYLSLRAVGQCYRIVYAIDRDIITVLVVAIGIRKDGDKKDIYTLARKLLRLHLLDDPDKDP